MSITIYAAPEQPAEGWLTDLFRAAGVEPSWIDTADGSEGQASITGLGYHSAPVLAVQNGDQLSSWRTLTPATVAAAISVEQDAIKADTTIHHRRLLKVAA